VQVILEHLEKLIVQHYDMAEQVYHSIEPSPINVAPKNRKDRSPHLPTATLGTEYCQYARFFVFAFVSYQTHRKQSSFDNDYWENWDGCGYLERLESASYESQTQTNSNENSSSSLISQEDATEKQLAKENYEVPMEEQHTVERCHGIVQTVNSNNRGLSPPPSSSQSRVPYPSADSPPRRPDSPPLVPLRPSSPAPLMAHTTAQPPTRAKLDKLDILGIDDEIKQFFNFEFPANSRNSENNQEPPLSPDARRHDEREKEKEREREKEREKERGRERKLNEEKDKITIVTKLIAMVGYGGFNLEPNLKRIIRLDPFFLQYIPHSSDLESTFFHWVCYGQYAHTEIFETSIITASVLSNRVLCFFLSADKSFIFENFYYLKKNESVFLLDKEIKTVVLQSVNYCKFMMTPLFPGKVRNLKNITNVNNFLCQLDSMVLRKVMANVNIFFKGENEITYADVLTITKCSDPLFKEFVKAMDVENDYQLLGETEISTKLHVTPISFVEHENFALVLFHNSPKPFDLLKFACNSQKIICLVTPFRHTPSLRMTSSNGEGGLNLGGGNSANISPTLSSAFGSSSGGSPQVTSRGEGANVSGANAPNSGGTTGMPKQLYKITLMVHLTLSQNSSTEQAEIANRLRSIRMLLLLLLLLLLMLYCCSSCVIAFLSFYFCHFLFENCLTL
jgi:hypothetical protein